MARFAAFMAVMALITALLLIDLAYSYVYVGYGLHPVLGAAGTACLLWCASRMVRLAREW
jgi:hypothetical protein